MTDQGALERRYRRLISWFPREFRQEHGEEILSVLMSGAREGQRRPEFSTVADLIRSGLWMRLRPNLPRSAPTVRAAVWLMYAGAALTILSLIGVVIWLPFAGRDAALLRVGGRTQPLPVAITVGVLIALIMTALWLWMARASSRGRSWARIISALLVGMATLQLFGTIGDVQLAFALVTWAVGLAAVWLLWRPASSAFFEQQRRTHGAKHEPR